MIRSKLENKYQEFFKKFEIDEKTGCLKNKPQIKFATYPYIGSKYGIAKKILIVGLDIGEDEISGRIQSFRDRRKAIEGKSVSEHNPHIAGTYFTALYFLKDELNWQKYWNDLKNIPTCQKALQNKEILPPKSNPLSYIALTNYYKFVSINRKNKSGGENRRHIDKKYELNFFINEVKILNPKIIVFQSKSFEHKVELQKRLLEMGKSVYIGYHPAYRGKREPDYFVKNIIKV